MLATMLCRKRTAGSGASPQEVLSGDWSLRHLPDSSGKQWRPRVFPFPIRTFLSRRHGLCGTRSPNSNRPGPPSDRSFDRWNWRLRSRTQECHVGQILRGPEPSGFAPIRSCSVPRAVQVQVGRRRGGQTRTICQAEGGEQGDPLMPLLFSLAIHNALAEVKREQLPGELLFAFLDDIYVVCSQARVRTVFNLLSVKLSDRAGIRLHAGKTRVWNKAGICPPNMGDRSRGVELRGSRSWAPQSVQMRMCRLLPRTDWKRNAVCGRPFHGCRTFNAVGKSSCSALDPVVTTS